MSKAVLEKILTAARDCLDSAKLLSAIRPAVREQVPDYEGCLDVSLSQQLELLGALMSEYMSFCSKEEYEAEEVGEEPFSYADAIHLLDRFVAQAREAVSTALKNSEYLFRAMEIGVRAQTFASVVRSKELREEH